jgi:hypothetical protein
MKFYCNRQIDKSAAEDKHLFRAQDIFRWAHDASMDPSVFINRSFASFATHQDVNAVTGSPNYPFSAYLHDFMTHELRFEAELADCFDESVKPFCKMLDELCVQSDV